MNDTTDDAIRPDAQLARDRKTAWALNGYNGSGHPGYAAQVLGRYQHLVFVR